MRIFILMKDGWPVSVFDVEYWADQNRDRAEREQPDHHWLILEFKISEEQ